MWTDFRASLEATVDRHGRNIAGAVLAGGIAVPSAPAWAGDAKGIRVRTTRRRPDVYDLGVTVRSKDTGWDGSADRQKAIGPDGTVIATRPLDHPLLTTNSRSRVTSAGCMSWESRRSQSARI